MLQSMTGYSSIDTELNQISLNIELKSVNHRYFDCKLRIPSFLNKADPLIRTTLKNILKRGYCECNIKTVNKSDKKNAFNSLSLNIPLLDQYLNAQEILENNYGIKKDLNSSVILNIPGIFCISDNNISDENIQKELIPALSTCADNLINMQTIEADNLKKEIMTYYKKIEEDILEIEELSKALIDNNIEKLKEKLNAILEGKEINEERITIEAGIIANKLDISEEIDRFKGHIVQFKKLLHGEESPIGRKIDFIIQEINRETNTICSKAEQQEIIHIAVTIKANIEKIREQIQNVK